jgi:hypothetical protein
MDEKNKFEYEFSIGDIVRIVFPARFGLMPDSEHDPYGPSYGIVINIEDWDPAIDYPYCVKVLYSKEEIPSMYEAGNWNYGSGVYQVGEEELMLIA